jgi:hypothetical protein
MAHVLMRVQVEERQVRTLEDHWLILSCIRYWMSSI